MANTLYREAVYQIERQHYTEAEPLLLRALRIREKKLGPTHKLTADTHLELARLYRELQRDDEAEQHFQRALHAYEQALSLTHISTGTTLQELARIYRAQ